MIRHRIVRVIKNKLEMKQGTSLDACKVTVYEIASFR